MSGLAILIVEDEPGKLEKLRDFVEENFTSPKLTSVQSFHEFSSLGDISCFDLIFLDMSIPNFDSPDDAEVGGLHFGGMEIMRLLKRRRPTWIARSMRRGELSRHGRNWR